MAAPVSIYEGPPSEAWSILYSLDGSNNREYVGLARSIQVRYTLAVTAISKAVDASISCVAHGLQVGNLIAISGATGDWAALNGNHAIKAISSADAFTIEPDTTAYAGTFDGVVKSQAPRTNWPVWSIQKLFYTTTYETRGAWANGSSADDKIWDNRATYAFN